MAMCELFVENFEGRQDFDVVLDNCPCGHPIRNHPHRPAAPAAVAIGGGGMAAPVAVAATITPSRATTKNVNLLKKELKITEERKVAAFDTLASLYGDPHNVPTVGETHFDMIQNWVGSQAEKMTAAKNHLEMQLAKFIPNVAQDFSFKDVHGQSNLWDFTLKSAKVRGTTDIVVAAADSVDDAEGLAPQILLCFELKDPPGDNRPARYETRQIKVELLAARAASKRPVVCFLTDLTNGALSLRVVALPNENFEIVQSEVTLDEMALISAAILKPEYKTVRFQIDEVAANVTAGPEQDAVFYKRKYEELSHDDREGVLQDLLEDPDLPLRYKYQAVRETLRLGGLHSNLLDAQEEIFCQQQQQQQQLYFREGCSSQRGGGGTGWTSIYT